MFPYLLPGRGRGAFAEPLGCSEGTDGSDGRHYQ